MESSQGAAQSPPPPLPHTRYRIVAQLGICSQWSWSVQLKSLGATTIEGGSDHRKTFALLRPHGGESHIWYLKWMQILAQKEDVFETKINEEMRPADKSVVTKQRPQNSS